ncbi:MAG: CHAT domain-containing protein [Caldilineaceae bacterium]|nr:CHAT domain-containing protein [Caldilineaceae bacterium]MBP9071068.1 CHAT domain-containing protein [Caldilineaceae bacterium]
MIPCTFENFDITIQGNHRPFLTTVTYRGQSAEGKFDQESTLAEWQDFDAQADTGKSGPLNIAQQGSQLFRALIHADLRDLWVTAQSELDRDQVAGLRVRLNLRPPTVAALPWEILRDPDRRRTLAANKRILLVRMETLHRYVGPSRPLTATLPLKLLLALPTDPTGQIDGAAEEVALRAGLNKVAQGRITLIPLPGKFNVLELGQALERERPDILHIVTHGQPDGLLLWQDGEPTFVSPDSLRTALEWTDSVKLVVLNACQTARDAAPTPMNSLGAHLLQSGLPAVIGMQYAIKDQAAMRFSQLLYTSLMDGPCAGRVDAAVAQARSGLFALNNGDTSFGTPVLWLNSQDGVIFNLPSVNPPPSIPNPVPPPPPAPEMEITSIRIWIDSFLQRSPDNFTGDLKLLAIQQHQALKDLWNNLTQLQGLYARRQHGDPVSVAIRRLEENIMDQQDTVQRLESLIQTHIG